MLKKLHFWSGNASLTKYHGYLKDIFTDVDIIFQFQLNVLVFIVTVQSYCCSHCAGIFFGIVSVL